MKVTATVRLSGEHAVSERRFSKEVSSIAEGEAWVKALAESAERAGHMLAMATIH